MKKKEETVAQKALRLIKRVGKDRFIVDSYSNNTDKCCVLGHINRLTSRNPKDYSTYNCSNSNGDDGKIRRASMYFLREATGTLTSSDIATVNNGNTTLYKQPIIKDRVVACLTDMIEAGY